MHSIKFLLLAFFYLSSLALFAKDFSGYVDPFARLDLSFAEPGVITELHVQEGDLVSKDMLLASLNKKAQEADLAMEQERLELDRTRLEQLKKLQPTGNVSVDELDKAQSEYNISLSRVERMQADIDARLLKSPLNSATVSVVHKKAGESVTNLQDSVITLVNIDTLVLNVYIDQLQVKKLSVGMKLSISFDPTLNLPPAEGKVTFISPDGDKASGTARVKLLIDNPNHTYFGGLLATVTVPD